MGRIFLIADDSKLIELSETPYPSEDHLQGLLAQYPALLPGDEINPENPRRWLLVSREAGVPGEEEGAARWSLDHLFLDQDGVPTLVEVKRSKDTRIRREVVGQMLDYAANGVAYWPVERLQALFASSCEQSGDDPDELLDEFIQSGSPEEFWKNVKTNLQAGRVRMVFVADEVPAELQRVVEFLNNQMDPAEVLAVEIPRYSGGGLQTLVPRLIGQTAEARARKSTTTSGRQWDEPTFLDELERREGAQARAVAKSIMVWCKEQGLRSDWGSGSRSGSYFPVLDHEGNWYAPFALWTYGQVETQFQYLKERPAFSLEEDRHEMRGRFNEIAGIDIPPDGIERRPSFPIAVLTNSSGLTGFLSVVEWMLARIRDSQ